LKDGFKETVIPHHELFDLIRDWYFKS